jgi:hypothetical protein
MVHLVVQQRRHCWRCAQLKKIATFVLNRVLLLCPASPRKNALYGFFHARTGVFLKKTLRLKKLPSVYG